jgi:hypothetical protein
MMGDILRFTDEAVDFTIEALASAPIERLEIRNGLEVLVHELEELVYQHATLTHFQNSGAIRCSHQKAAMVPMP